LVLVELWQQYLRRYGLWGIFVLAPFCVHVEPLLDAGMLPLF
jgi:hypothetical protein